MFSSTNRSNLLVHLKRLTWRICVYVVGTMLHFKVLIGIINCLIKMTAALGKNKGIYSKSTENFERNNYEIMRAGEQFM